MIKSSVTVVIVLFLKPIYILKEKMSIKTKMISNKHEIFISNKCYRFIESTDVFYMVEKSEACFHVM